VTPFTKVGQVVQTNHWQVAVFFRRFCAVNVISNDLGWPL